MNQLHNLILVAGIHWAMDLRFNFTLNQAELNEKKINENK
jgi:hypothetical protein